MEFGSLTNLAIAATMEPETFCRAKEVLGMAAPFLYPGNITPVADFNVFTDPLAAGVAHGLNSSHPTTMMSKPVPANRTKFVSTKPLKLALFALGLTGRHLLCKFDVEEEIGDVL